MKKWIPTFLAGMATMALIGSLSFSALAASGSFTITVDPINIQVNGATFQPKDTQGKDVPVFIYNGTTYAPLRALAEAYGLEVGYDAKANMATVGEAPTDTPTTPDNTAPADYSDWSAEDEAAYQEFKGMWEVELTYSNTSDPDPINNGFLYVATPKAINTVSRYWNSIDKSQIKSFVSRFFFELSAKNPDYACRFYLEYGTQGAEGYRNFAFIMGGGDYIHTVTIFE